MLETITEQSERETIYADPQELLENVVAPFCTECTGDGDLEEDNPLVQQLITDYNLAPRDKYLDLQGGPKSDSEQTRRLVAHSINPKESHGIFEAGGVLGVGVHTLYSGREVQEGLEHTQNTIVPQEYQRDVFVYLPPSELVGSNTPRLPLRLFDPEITLEDLPKGYLREVKTSHGFEGAQLVNTTNILPNDYLLAVVRAEL